MKKDKTTSRPGEELMNNSAKNMARMNPKYAGNPDTNEQSTINMPEMHGDQTIYLGQSILALIRLNYSGVYTSKQNKEFTIELLNSLLEELGITHAELIEEWKSRDDWDEDEQPDEVIVKRSDYKF